MPVRLSLVRLSLVGLCLVGLCVAFACSDPVIEPASTPTPTPTPRPTPQPHEAPPDEATPALDEALEVAMVPGTLRLIVLRPETLLQREEQTLAGLLEALDDTDFQVLRDEPSPAERSALSTFFGGGEWARPTAWAPHDVVLALEFVEPAMLGRANRPYSQGLRTAALWTSEEEQPAYLQQSRLTPMSAIGRLATPRAVSGFLVQLSLDARSES